METSDAVTLSVEELPILQTLAPARQRALLSEAVMETYRRGEVIFRQGEHARAIWLVLDGWVHLFRASHPAHRTHSVLIFTITPDEALCGISAVDSGVYNMSAVAASPCRVLRLPGERFHDALANEPAFAYQVLRLCARRLQHIAEQYGTMAEPALHRIVRALLRLRRQFGSTLPMTHCEVAQMSWTTTETAIRTIRWLKQQRYVRGTRGRVTVDRVKSLEALLTAPSRRALSGATNGAAHG